MLLYICSDCGQWKMFLNLADIFKYIRSGELDVIPCPGRCGLMVQVQTNDRLGIIPLPKVEQIK